MPKIADPTPADVDKWHGRYVSELTRLFDTYKGLRVDFKDKQITINDK